MKAKKKLPETPAVPQEKPNPESHVKIPLAALRKLATSPLPDPPLFHQEPPMIGPDITCAEIGAFIDARQVYRLARADYEEKRGKVLVKLLQFCTAARGSHYQIDLDDSGMLHVRDYSSRPPICFDEKVY